MQLLAIADYIHIITSPLMALNVSLADDIDELLIDFYAHANAVHLITCDERGTGAQKRVEHDAVYQGTYEGSNIYFSFAHNFCGACGMMP